MYEVWKQVSIDGVLFDYEVSNLGNIQKFSTKKIIKCHKDDGGYIIANIMKPEIGYKSCKSIHRLVAKAFIPNPKKLPEVNHFDGNKENNTVTNLEWVSRKRNIRHALDSGLRNSVCIEGEGTWNNKYSKEQILQVADLIQSGQYSFREIAEITGVKRTTIKKISQKKQWRSLLNEYNFDIRIERKNCDYSRFHNAIDRAIIAGKSKSTIVEKLCDNGLDENAAKTLFARRQRRVKKGKSVVQNTIYIDNGIEIF